MRATLLMLCLAAFAVRAQTQTGGGSEVEGTEVQQPPTQRPAPEQGQVQTAPPEGPSQVHTVEKGDTLWDLSSKYLGSPWYWPKVWSYNPQIANPHWIYPGNQVRFYPGNGGAQETPARAEVMSLEGDDLEDTKPFEGDDEDVQLVRIPVETKTRELVVKDGFATPNEVEA
ncbi:MAG TPA: LysM peptidoglycan-binding domain-containing protein, partial [Myxococcaceae bacterium]|nr:LysM peptidoglycan-binding domain-containing protein [Myxococcaceae bacterium]